jgi:integrase
MRVIRPDDPGNPFRPKLRVRNHAIILLAYNLGLRAGEEFGLKGKDYVTREHPATITVHRRPSDPDETRNEPALTKTLSRTLYVDGGTRLAMDAWIRDRQDRAKYPQARKHPYIFVATNGSKMTLRAVREVYARLRAVHPELAGVGQHILRHDANDRWVEYNEDKDLDPMNARQDQCYAMGWTSTSSQPENYAKAAIRRRTNKRLVDMQRKMTKPEKG